MSTVALSRRRLDVSSHFDRMLLRLLKVALLMSRALKSNMVAKWRIRSCQMEVNVEWAVNTSR